MMPLKFSPKAVAGIVTATMTIMSLIFWAAATYRIDADSSRFLAWVSHQDGRWLVNELEESFVSQTADIADQSIGTYRLADSGLFVLEDSRGNPRSPALLDPMGYRRAGGSRQDYSLALFDGQAYIVSWIERDSEETSKVESREVEPRALLKPFNSESFLKRVAELDSTSGTSLVWKLYNDEGQLLHDSRIETEHGEGDLEIEDSVVAALLEPQTIRQNTIQNSEGIFGLTPARKLNAFVIWGVSKESTDASIFDTVAFILGATLGVSFLLGAGAWLSLIAISKLSHRMRNRREGLADVTDA